MVLVFAFTTAFPDCSVGADAVADVDTAKPAESPASSIGDLGPESSDEDAKRMDRAARFGLGYKKRWYGSYHRGGYYGGRHGGGRYGKYYGHGKHYGRW